ncbi:helix-turn-helix domain-containing protein [Cumulibacter soli]|uniref:helix-turn-helix domain-containing protein n=1 Tax=Cumulibacter soli TaxID=2546344 RepID=UPI001067DCEF|nr:helix-turn-helix transcriptional regulator [Cumulibacter soli]
MPESLEQVVDRRQLPQYAAGAIQVPYVIDGMAEQVHWRTDWEAHSHPTHELLWNDKGASTATVGNRTWTITPSVGLWIPAGTMHHGSMPAGTRYRTAHFSFHDVFALAERPVAVEMTPLLRLLLDRLNEPGLGESSRGLTEKMVLDVLRPADRELLLQTPVSAAAAPIVRELQANPAIVRSLEEWAQQLNVSGRTLTRLFRHETGLDFTRWVAAFRTQRAIELLNQGMPIADIAQRVGFASVSAFGSAFRRVTGMSPGQFRAQ